MAGQTVVDLNVTAAVRNTIREIPIVIQDRSFNADGSLFYPETRAFFEGVEPRQLRIPFIPNRRSDISPTWNPEAFFNVMVVNGVSWPKLEVAPADPATTGRVMRFVVNATLAKDGGPLGASPTDPVLANGESNPDAATDPGALALNAEGVLGGAAVQRSVSLNEMMRPYVVSAP